MQTDRCFKSNGFVCQPTGCSDGERHGESAKHGSAQAATPAELDGERADLDAEATQHGSACTQAAASAALIPGESEGANPCMATVVVTRHEVSSPFCSSHAAVSDGSSNSSQTSLVLASLETTGGRMPKMECYDRKSKMEGYAKVRLQDRRLLFHGVSHLHRSSQ